MRFGRQTQAQRRRALFRAVDEHAGLGPSPHLNLAELGLQVQPHAGGLPGWSDQLAAQAGIAWAEIGDIDRGVGRHALVLSRIDPFAVDQQAPVRRTHLKGQGRGWPPETVGALD